ncbi:MAG: 3-oxoacyl-ACP synthase, partial [Myxococcales bacterium]|nr:3-oxoacyl-ACP synthase [Myxococcales bacterium]
MSPAVVMGAEVCTSLGLDLDTTALEIEAGTQRVEDTPVLDVGGEPARAARLAVLPPGHGRVRRMAALGVTALRPLVEALLRAGQARVALYLGLPTEDDLPATEASGVLSALRAAAAPLQLVLPRRGVYAAGRAAAFLALEGAMQQLDQGAIDMALVGAVDCLCDTGSLVELVARRELLGPANIEGRLVGEGAGFLWLASERQALPRGLVPPRVLGVATGREPRRTGPAPSLGEGLTVVMRALRRDPHAGRLATDRMLSCQTDQGHWNTELSWAYLRNAALFPEPFEPEHLPAALADTGAAAGAIALAVATRAKHGAAPASRT